MIDKNKFFKLCRVVGVKEIARRLDIVPTTIYTWMEKDRIAPLKWEKVDSFMKKFEADNAELLEKKKFYSSI